MPNTYVPVELLSAVAENELAETRLTEAPLLGILAASAMPQNQRAIQWPAKLTDADIGGRAVAGAITDDTAGSIGKAEIAIPDYYFKHKFQVVKRDLVEAAATGKVDVVQNAVGAQVNDALLSFVQKINSVLYTGVGTLNTSSFGVLGLDEVAKQTGTYAGISRATYPRWRSIVQQGATPGTAEQLSVDRVTSLLRARRKAGATSMRNNGTRLIAVTSDEIDTDVLRKLYKEETQVQSDYSGAVAAIEPYMSYSVKGIPVISDVATPTENKIYFLDPSKLSLYCFNDESSELDDDYISYFSYMNLKFRMAQVGDRHPDVYDMELSTSLQLKCHDPARGLSVMEDVLHTYTAA